MSSSATPRLLPTRDLVMAALVASLISASAYIQIPMGAVPVTLQVFVVLLAGMVLSPLAAGLSMLVYLLLGAAGVPVFAGGTAGLGVLFGPTGGYLFGFAVAAVAVSLVRSALRGTVSFPVAGAIAAVPGIALIYGIGWVVLTQVTGMGWGPAFAAGVVPFVAIDAVKAVVAVVIAAALERAGLVS